MSASLVESLGKPALRCDRQTPCLAIVTVGVTQTLWMLSGLSPRDNSMPLLRFLTKSIPSRPYKCWDVTRTDGVSTPLTSPALLPQVNRSCVKSRFFHVGRRYGHPLALSQLYFFPSLVAEKDSPLATVGLEISTLFGVQLAGANGGFVAITAIRFLE